MLPTFRDNLAHLKGSVWTLVVFPNRRFGKTICHIFKCLKVLSGNILPTFRKNPLVTSSTFFWLLVVIFCGRFGTIYQSIFKCLSVLIRQIFKFLLVLGCNILPNFRKNISDLSSAVFWLLVVIYYRRFGTTYRPQIQGNFF